MKFNKLIIGATLVASFTLTGCKSTESVKYVDRDVLVPKIIVEYCGVDIVKKCKKYIDSNKDLVECFLFNESEIDKANEIIELCKQKNKEKK